MSREVTLLTSLLAAIELTGGERIVLRSGELPHLIVAGKRHDLGTGTVSTAAALESLADQILTASSKKALSEEGLAVEPLDDSLSAVPVVVTVRRIGHDMCVELRRAAQPTKTATPASSAPSTDPIPAPSSKAPATDRIPAPSSKAPATDRIPAPSSKAPATDRIPAPSSKAPATDRIPAPSSKAPATDRIPEPLSKAPATDRIPAPSSQAPSVDGVPAATLESSGIASKWSIKRRQTKESSPPPVADVPQPESAETLQPDAVFSPPEEAQHADNGTMMAFDSEVVEAVADTPVAPEDIPPPPTSLSVEPPPYIDSGRVEPAAVKPDRDGVTSFVGMTAARLTGDAVDGLDALVRQAAQREAAALYLRVGQVPLARIHGRIEPLSADCIDGSLMSTIRTMFAANPPDGDSARAWARRYDDLGEISGHAFVDDEGSGAVIRLQTNESGHIEERDIPRHIRFVCAEDDGVVFVCGTTTTSVLEMVAAVAAWTAARRGGHLISIEPPNGLGRAIVGPFVSARRVKGNDTEVAEAVARAVSEEPDVLVVGLAPGVAVEEALRCCRPGRLVILGAVAGTAPQALDSLLTSLTPRGDEDARQLLALWFRGAFSYRPVRGIDGRRKTVYDMLIPTPEIQARLERWERWDVRAVEEIQRTTDGMLPLDAALANAVGRGDISVRHAVAHALDPRAFAGSIRQSVRETRARRSNEDGSPGALRETVDVA